MATIGSDPNGHKRILFVAGDGARKSIRLGKASMKQADAIKVKVEDLVAATKGAGVIQDETSRWLAALDDRMHPSHVCTAWLGHTEDVANEFYRQVTDEHFSRAITVPDAIPGSCAP